MSVSRFSAAVLAATILLAPAAQAATYIFTCGATGYRSGACGGDLGASAVFTAPGGPAVTVTAGSAGILNDGLATLTQNGNGLGVNGRFDLNPGQIDGFPVGSSEFVTFSFAWAVNLLNITFFNVDLNDQFDYSVNGGAFVNNRTIGTRVVPHELALQSVRTLVIRASGTPFVDGLGNDDFSIARLEVAAVPLPAGGVLLLSALGAGAFVARRRRAA